jgi:hypothetical protein
MIRTERVSHAPCRLHTFDWNTGEAIPFVNKNIVTLGLSIQTGPGAPECHGTMILLCILQRLRDLVGRFRDNHDLREETIRT